jgi:hypothetical protein
MCVTFPKTNSIQHFYYYKIIKYIPLAKKYKVFKIINCNHINLHNSTNLPDDLGVLGGVECAPETTLLAVTPACFLTTKKLVK